MARGPKTKPPIDELRAGFWYWALNEAVMQQVGETMNGEKLARYWRQKLGRDTILADPKQLGRYRRGQKNPSEQTLKTVERLYPGTRMFFESGPWFSYLWTALDPSSDPQDALTAIETTWRSGMHVEHGVEVGGEQGIQDVIVPAELATRWKVKPSARLNLAEKCQPWESPDDVCAQLLGFDETYVGGGVLTLVPSATFTKEERLKASPKVRMPFFVGLSYRIAQARIKGENSLILNSATEPRNTSFAGWLLKQLLAKLLDVTGFKIIVEEETCLVAYQTDYSG